MDEVGPLYVKFGKTRNLITRLTSIRTACPIPAKLFWIIETPRAKVQADLERGLHKYFSGRRTSGEWFRFDLDSLEDKQHFHHGCAQQLAYHLGPGHNWTEISVTDLENHAARLKRGFLNSPHRKKILKKAEEEKRLKRAWRELGPE